MGRRRRRRHRHRDESLGEHPQLVSFRSISVHIALSRRPAKHPGQPALALQELARRPLSPTTRRYRPLRINRAFERRRIEPNIALTALDADGFKTYVSLGLVRHHAKLAFDPA
jgi:hypothetical protein